MYSTDKYSNVYVLQLSMLADYYLSKHDYNPLPSQEKPKGCQSISPPCIQVHKIFMNGLNYFASVAELFLHSFCIYAASIMTLLRAAFSLFSQTFFSMPRVRHVLCLCFILGLQVPLGTVYCNFLHRFNQILYSVFIISCIWLRVPMCVQLISHATVWGLRNRYP